MGETIEAPKSKEKYSYKHRYTRWGIDTHDTSILPYVSICKEFICCHAISFLSCYEKRIWVYTYMCICWQNTDIHIHTHTDPGFSRYLSKSCSLLLSSPAYDIWTFFNHNFDQYVKIVWFMASEHVNKVTFEGLDKIWTLPLFCDLVGLKLLCNLCEPIWSTNLLMNWKLVGLNSTHVQKYKKSWWY